jgi:hypothetical protein
MTHLVRYIDNPPYGCWARIDMKSGELCYISVARTGLLIKESNFGILGRVVFKVGSVDALAFLAMSLNEEQNDDLTPPDMRSPVLKVITNAILHFDTLDEIPRSFGFWVGPHGLYCGPH